MQTSKAMEVELSDENGVKRFAQHVGKSLNVLLKLEMKYV